MKKFYSYLRSSSPFKIIALAFFAVIVTGSVLLYLPISHAEQNSYSYIDALFTSGSAVCVTGLVVQDTGTYWSTFGKTIIMILIQIGGLGVITVVVTASLLTGKKIGLRQRDIIQSAINAPYIGGVVRFTKFIILFTAAVEGAGACLLAPSFIKQYGFTEGVRKAAFHSISAFCNAGFDVFNNNGRFNSLMQYKSNVVVNVIIMGLIVIGGLGFFTWEDLIKNKFRWSKLQMQTKLIIVVTLTLIFVPALLFFTFEFTKGAVSERILLSMFQSVTTRTAGFNTAEISELKEGSRFLMIILMLIGGSPCSTAGGIKTVTIAVLIMSVCANIRKDKNACAFERTVSDKNISEAHTIFFLYTIFFITSSLTMNAIEGIPLFNCMFECASALGTVGLSTGITPSLGSVSKIILIFLMYFGRVGGLTLAYAAMQPEKTQKGKTPKVSLMIG